MEIATEFNFNSEVQQVQSQMQLSDLEIAKVEQQHLYYFTHNTHLFFDHVLYQKEKFNHHLYDFTQRSQSQRLIFGPYVDELRYIQSYLEFEIPIINEYFQILWGHHATLTHLCTFNNFAVVQMPNMNSVRQTAHNVLDRIVDFQTRLFATMITPLTRMEKDLQQLIVTDVAGKTSWQQEIPIPPQPLKAISTETFVSDSGDKTTEKSI